MRDEKGRFLKGNIPDPKTLRTSFKKGHTPWHKGKTGVYSNNANIKRSEALKGNKNTLGKKASIITRNKMSEMRRGEKHHLYGKHHSDVAKDKIRIARRRQKFPIKNTQPELKFKEICGKNNLPFIYTGDGSYWIGDINPDFIHRNGKKVVIEIFGDYWHSPLLRPNMGYYQTHEGRKNKLKKLGWKLIVFWESDMCREDAEKFVLSQLKKDGVL